MGKVTLKIDGVTIKADPGQTILEAALENGIYIPHLCSHENLLPAGACRMCSVRVEGTDGIVTACSVRVREGMVVDTRDELAEKIRKLSCDLIVRTHPSDCTGCPKYGKCQLQTIIQVVGDTGRRLRNNKILTPANGTNPVILHEMYRCILCGRCVRACHDMRGVGAIKLETVNGRMQVVIDGDSLNDAACRFYGYSREELAGICLFDINMTPPEEFKRHLLRIRNGERSSFVFHHRRKDGALRKVDVQASPVLYDGKALVFSLVREMAEGEQKHEDGFSR